MQSAARVGLLLVVFMGLLVGAYSILGKSVFGSRVDTYYVELPDAGGVADGAEVLMAGVSIGSVTEVKLISPTKARIKLEVKEGTKIPEGSVAQLPTSLIGLGETPVILVAPAQPTSVSLAPGATLIGSRPSPLDNILPDSQKTVAELNKTMAAFRKLLENEKLQTKVVDLLTTSNKTLEKFGTLADNVSGLLNSNRADISKAIAAASAAVQDVRKVTLRVAQLAQDGKLKSDATAIMDRIKTISAHADDMIQSLNQLVNDPKLRGPVARSASNIEDITQTGKKIATNVEEMTRNGTEITKNGVTVSQKAITLTDKANEIATKASQIEDQLKLVLDKVSGFFNKAPTSADIPKITTEIDEFRETKPGYWRTDVSVRFPLQDSTVNLGLYDALESNRVTAELGRNLNSRLAFRYGVYASTASVGVDYSLAPRWSLTGDAWQINDPRLDLRTSYDFGNGFIGWFGFDRVLKDNAITFGVGLRK